MESWEEQVNELFEDFIRENNFNSNQLRFLQVVKSLILQGKYENFPDDFYSPVFEGQFGIGAFDRLFGDDEAEKLIGFVSRFKREE